MYNDLKPLFYFIFPNFQYKSGTSAIVNDESKFSSIHYSAAGTKTSSRTPSLLVWWMQTEKLTFVRKTSKSEMTTCLELVVGRGCCCSSGCSLRLPSPAGVMRGAGAGRLLLRPYSTT